MKRTIVFLSLISFAFFSWAQLTTINSSNERLYEDGVNLYQQQHYAASQRMLTDYLLSAAAPKNKELAEFYLAANAFELRQTDAQKQLQAYLKAYPYTTYSSEVYFMLGTLLLEKGKFKQSLKQFEKADVNRVSRDHQAELLFSRGYAHLETHEPQRAALYFGKLKEQESIYKQQAQYYYSYCQYAIGNYGKALPGFLSLENSELYKDVVPYYIVQIYYQQKQYDEVYERAERLLTYDKESENSGELHRMLGEIYYQQGKYTEAISHLTAYERSFTEQKKSLLREDIYLLAMSYYQIEDYEKAVLWFKKVKKENDLISQNTCMHEGNAYVKLKHIELAKISYAAAMRYNFDPQMQEEAAYNYAITTYLSSSALGESVTAFTDFIKQYPESKHKEEVYSLLSDVFLSSKNYSAAYDAISQIENPTAQMLQTKQYLRYQMAVEAYRQGKRDQAIDLFTDVINNEKKTSIYKTESYYWRAECRYQLHDLEAAKADINAYQAEKNIKESKNRIISNYLKGYILFSEKQYDAAQTAFNQYVATAERTESTYADALNRIGDCFFSSRNFQKAENCYAQVVALGGAGADYALFQRGYAMGLMKRYNDKINILEKLVKQYPRSDYADDALYEIARAELMRNQNQAAIDTYERLLATYPNSNMARKAALEKGMIYNNIGEHNKAIEAYKQVIKNYPQTEEAYLALDGLQQVYVETNNISEYLSYTKTLGKLKMDVTNHEDSLVYIAAERQYMLGNYKDASAGLKQYMNKFCSGGRYCTTAQYYLADSYYRLDRRHEALVEYKQLTQLSGNPYMEEACLRAAEITYDEKDYATSRQYFKQLEKAASTIDKMNVARLGVLRCSYILGDTETTINIASQIIDDSSSAKEVQDEARYQRGKAFYALKQYDLALSDLTLTATDVSTAQGAEAKYLVAQAYFDIFETEKAEEQIMEFAQQNTSHQYWLARSFILLSDIYQDKGDNFQAKQYLLSLEQNYKNKDDIQDLIKERLDKIDQQEQQPTTNDDEDNE